MKKLGLSLGVIFLYAIYSLTQQKPAQGMAVLPIPTNGLSPTPKNSGSASTQGLYKDGAYVGGLADAFYGNVQVKAIINNGKITDVQFLQYPSDRSRSMMISSMAMPVLTSEAITAQSENVDIVSGATDTSGAFIQSLGSALASAKN
jgi:uncharacterized protein with FMN-binding domain